jgi:carbonic anhydrase
MAVDIACQKSAGLWRRGKRIHKPLDWIGMRLPARLSEGYLAFLETRLPLERSRFERLAASGQRPAVMVIGCCDSRVSPEVIFDAHPGEIFVLRNVANLVSPYDPSELPHGIPAALEFAVQILKVEYILVMGHSHCGGIRAFVEHRGRPNKGDFIDNWMSLITPAADSIGSPGEASDADYLGRLERASVVATLGNLMTFPDIRARVNAGDLKLLGAHFDIGNGDLALYDEQSGTFAAATELSLQHAPVLDNAS